MDKDTLQIIIMIGGFAITGIGVIATIITLVLRFPSRDEMNNRFNDNRDEMNNRFNDMNQRLIDMNQRLIELREDVRNIYHILIQEKPNKPNKEE